MAFDNGKFMEIIDEFTFDQDRLAMVAGDFRYDLRQGLRSRDMSSLRLLPSYAELPTGRETGEYLALDFGGTNVRALRIRLQGEGRIEVVKKVKKPLIVPGEYDYVGEGSTAAEQFGFLAGLIGEAVDGDKATHFYLGHTFSFPSEQTDLADAKLILWTKEFQTRGVEGAFVNKLLADALRDKGFTNIEPVAVVNDTVAVLLAGAYTYGDMYIGSIYGTGHNSCYYETFAGAAEKPQILNLESGRFKKLIPDRFDVMLDDASEKPGEQRLEKMVSGRYLGELFSLALGELFGEKGDYGFTTIDLGTMVSDETAGLSAVTRLVEEKTGHKLEDVDANRVQELATAIAIRSARLVTATYAGLIWQMAGDGEVKKQHIGIDGSLYEHMPRVTEHINRALSELLGEDAAKVDTVSVADGSGYGAAIAAAMAATAKK